MRHDVTHLTGKWVTVFVREKLPPAPDTFSERQTTPWIRTLPEMG